MILPKPGSEARAEWQLESEPLVLPNSQRNENNFLLTLLEHAMEIYVELLAV